MNKIIEYALKHPLVIIMHTILIFITGIICLFTIPMDFLPTLSDRHILISTKYAGIPAEQMKELITIPIEDSFSSLKGIQNIHSTTRDGLSFVKIELQYKTNINSSLIEARQIIDKLVATLPQECEKPELEIYSTEKNKLLTISLIPENNSLIYARDLANKEFKHTLQTVSGVGKIKIHGGEEEQINIFFDSNSLNQRKLTLTDIASIIKSTNYEYPLGTIKDETNEYIIKASNLFKTHNDIMNTFIPYENTTLMLKDLGKLSPGIKQKKCFAMYNKQESILIHVYKKSDSNPIKTSKLIKEKISEFNKQYPQIKFIITNDLSKEIKTSILNVFISAILGTIITFLIILFFFRNIKLSLIISFPIPLCILFSIIVLNIFNKSINLFSLSGITIAIGMTVDASIIVLESIISNKNKSKDKQIISSILSIKKSVISSSITTVIVFIPLFLLPGIFGELFTDLSISVISSIIFSLILSLTFIPVLAKLLIKNDEYICKNKILFYLQKKYKNILNSTIHNKKLFYKIILFTLIIIFCSIKFVKKELIPNSKTNSTIICVNHNNKLSLDLIQEKSRNLINDILKSIPNISIVTIGGIDPEDNYSLSDFSNNEKDVTFEIFHKSKNDIEKIQNIMKEHKLNFSIIKSKNIISKCFDINDNFIILESKNINLKNIPNAKPNNFIQEQTFIPDLKKCNFYQIPKFYISLYIYQIIEGVNAGDFYSKGKTIPIHLNCNFKNDLNNAYISFNKKTIPLSILGNFSTIETEKIFYRYNKKNAKEISSFPENLDSKNIISLKQNQVKELAINAIIILSIVLLLLYCILGAQFESFIIPLIFLLSLVPVFAGGLFSLFLFKQSLNINSVLAFVILLGTGVNNSIILYESIVNKKSNLFIKEFSNQLTPILTTTLTSCAALLPFTLDPFKINTQTSMSIALFFGLLTSLFINLIIIPIILKHLYGEKKWIKKFISFF